MTSGIPPTWARPKSAFLTSLAVRDKVAASTQNQALSALLYLYREVLGVELPWLDDVVRAKRPQYLPVVVGVYGWHVLTQSAFQFKLT